MALIRYGLYIKDSGHGELGWSRGVAGTLSGCPGIKAKTDAFFIADFPVAIEFRLHVEKLGWLGWVPQGDFSSSDNRRIEAIQFRFPNGLPADHVCMARVHVEGFGWKDNQIITDQTEIGTVGQSKRLESLQLMYGIGPQFENKNLLLHNATTLTQIEKGLKAGSLTDAEAIHQIREITKSCNPEAAEAELSACSEAIFHAGVATVTCPVSVLGGPLALFGACSATIIAGGQAVNACQMGEDTRKCIEARNAGLDVEKTLNRIREGGHIWGEIRGVDYTGERFGNVA